MYMGMHPAALILVLRSSVLLIAHFTSHFTRFLFLLSLSLSVLLCILRAAESFAG